MSYSRVNQKAEKTAQGILKEIAMKSARPKNLIIWIKYTFNVKIEVSHADLSDRGVSGFVYYDSISKTYKITVDENDPITKQRFTIVHELAHIIRGRELIYGFSDGDLETEGLVERFCNRFAAAFLMPEGEFKKIWGSTITLNRFLKRHAVALHFGVSEETVKYRALELGLS